MTKFEALIACRNHWSWLWITGSNDKSDYEKSNEWDFFCACCHFARFLDCDGSENCKSCPLLWHAWEFYENDDLNPCERESSPYEKWKNSIGSERKKQAKNIVHACNQAIEDMILNGEI